MKSDQTIFHRATRTFRACTFSVILLFLILTGTMLAQLPKGGKQGNSILAPTVELTQKFSMTVRGDYMAAGVGMRNRGYGNITINLPSNSTIVKAFLYWAIIRSNESGPASTVGTINSTQITGTIVGTAGTPCWPSFTAEDLANNSIDVYRAEVTGIAVDGTNYLTGFPSGVTTGVPPQQNAAFPLLEGASLVLIFTNPAFDYNTVVIFDGAKSFANHNVPLALGSYTPSPSSPIDPSVTTTFILADGQAVFPNDQIGVNATLIRGPGSGVDINDGIFGEDGISYEGFSLDGLWDTYTRNLSSMLPPGVTTAIVPNIVLASDNPDTWFDIEGGDCVTWAAQVFSVKTDIAACITGPTPVCQGSTNSYMVNNSATSIWNDVSYAWSFVGNAYGATFSGPTDGPTVAVVAGSNNYQVQCVISAGPGTPAAYTKTLTKTIEVKTPPSVTINTSSCQQNQTLYAGSSGHTFSASSYQYGVTYSWEITNNTSGASITYGTTSSTVTVKAGNTAGSFTLVVTATKCGCTSTATKVVTVLNSSYTHECKDYVYYSHQKITCKGEFSSRGKVHCNGDVDWDDGRPSAHQGDIRACGDVKVNCYNTINGDCKSGKSLTVDWRSTVTGQQGCNQSIDSRSLPTLNYGQFWGYDKTVWSNQTYTLNPGTYDDCTVYSYGNLILNSGTYNFDHLKFGNHVNVHFNLQDGPIKINVSSNIDMGGYDVDFFLHDGTSSMITVTTKQYYPLVMNSGSRIYGTFVAPNATIKLINGNISFQGSLCGNQIEVNNDCFVVNHDYEGSLPKYSPNLTDEIAIAETSSLSRAYPNPFSASKHSTTSIEYSLQNEAPVRIAMYDVLGREVKALVNEVQTAGPHAIQWNATDANGEQVNSGTYFYRLVIGDKSEMKQISLTR